MKKGVLCKYCEPIKETKIYCKLKKCEIENYKCGNSCKDRQFNPISFVTVGIGRCDECPCVKIERTPKAGYAFDYFCNAVQTASGPKKITGYVEYESEIPPIPDWCPFRGEEDYEIMD